MTDLRCKSNQCKLVKSRPIVDNSVLLLLYDEVEEHENVIMTAAYEDIYR